MTHLVVPQETVEWIEFAVQHPTDPTTDGPPEIGFSDETAAPTDWFAGEWSTDDRTVAMGNGYAKAHVARFLIGDGDLDLDGGVYRPWVRFTTGAETVVRPTGDTLGIGVEDPPSSGLLLSTGPPGPGFAPGGDPLSFLRKASADDFDTEWVSIVPYLAPLDDRLTAVELALPGLEETPDVNSAVTRLNALEALTPTLAVDSTVVHKTGAELVTGLKTFQAASAGAVGLIAKGAASQSVDIFQVQDSAGSGLVKFGSDGHPTYIGADGTAKMEIQRGSAGNGPWLLWTPTAGNGINGRIRREWPGNFIIDDGAGGNVGLTVKGPFLTNSSFTSSSDLFAWDGSGSQHSVKVGYNDIGTPQAGILFGSALDVGLKRIGVGQLELQGRSTASQLVIKEVASQSIDVLQAQDSTGAALAKVNKDGVIFAPVASVSGATAAFGSTVANQPVLYINGYGNANDGSGSLIQVQNKNTGANSIQAALGGTVGGFFRPATASGSGAIIKGLGSQTGDLEQWQDSTGAARAKINSVGQFHAVDADSIQLTNGAYSRVIATADLYLDSANAGKIVAIRPDATQQSLVLRAGASSITAAVKAAASQTADVQQWLDSAGGVFSKVSLAGVTFSRSAISGGNWEGIGVPSSGNIFEARQSGAVRAGVGQFGGLFSGGALLSGAAFSLDNTIGASAIVELIRGAASQTGDLAQYQNSAGSVLRSITAAGLPRWNAAANVQTTVGAAGAASALPATPSKYLKVVGDDGTTYVIPAYAAA